MPAGTTEERTSLTSDPDAAKTSTASAGDANKQSSTNVKPSKASTMNRKRKSPYEGCFAMSVYFPKFVCINNTRLSLVYYLLTGILIVFILYYFLIGSSAYFIPKPVAAMVHMCGDVSDSADSISNPLCRLSWQDMETQWKAFSNDNSVCANPSYYQYWKTTDKDLEPEKWKTTKYMPTGCARMCGSQTNANDFGAAENCWTPSDRLSVGPNMAFIPTYATQAYYTKKVDNGNGPECPAGTTATPNSNHCHHKDDVFVPAAEKIQVAFSHEFTSSPEQANMLFSEKDKKGFSLSDKAEGWSAGLKTYWFTHDGVKHKEFSGDWITATVEELLATADYEDVGSDGNLNLDHIYFTSRTVPKSSCPTETCSGPGRKNGASLRITGVTLTIDLRIVDTGECVNLKLDEITKVDTTGPVACMYVYAERGWTQDGKQFPVGSDGSYREMQYSGVRIKFRTTGAVRMFELTAVSYSFTVAVVWIQIPLVVVYYFAIFCLGHLSAVYRKVLHQTLNLGEATKGLATRLVSHSAAYMDLQDQPDGITKGCLLKRFQQILKSNSNLDNEEIVKYVDYVFEGMQSLEGNEVLINDSVNIEEFCTACCTNEPLSFDALVNLFDGDRKLTCLEKFFLDDTIRGVIKEAQIDRKSGRPSSSQTTLEMVDAGQEVLVNQLATLRTISEKVTEFAEQTDKMMKNALAELELNKDQARLAATIALDRKGMGKGVIDPITDFTPTEDPKPDQRESFGSVADEAEPGRS